MKFISITEEEQKHILSHKKYLDENYLNRNENVGNLNIFQLRNDVDVVYNCVKDLFGKYNVDPDLYDLIPEDGIFVLKEKK